MLKKVHSEVLDLHYRGFLRLRDQMYLIEPMAATEAGLDDGGARSDEGLHAVYNYEHLRRKRSSCSHGNTTTFYDHGAHPSGLFQLSSLVKAHRGDVVLQVSKSVFVLHRYVTALYPEQEEMMSSKILNSSYSREYNQRKKTSHVKFLKTSYMRDNHLAELHIGTQCYK